LLLQRWKKYNPGESEVEMVSTHVSELTVEELKALVRETVQQSLAEFLIDPDSGVELCESIQTSIHRSNKEIHEGSKLYSIHGSGTNTKKIPVNGKKISFYATIEEGMIKLPDEYINRIGQNVQVIGFLTKVEIQTQTLIDRLLTDPFQSKDFHPMSRNEIYDR
jgi:hypothetical protein